MHSKIIHPQVHGKAVYANKGSCARLVRYLQHEAREKGEGALFFNEEGEAVSAEEVQQRIDYNVKGLRKTESKFIALVLSPGPAELQHIHNEPDRLRQFTRKAMRNYAANFQLKGGKGIEGKDLLWFAAIHQNRTYKGNAPEVKEGQVKSGARKPGLQTHLHVIVSKRDRSQRITLSPFGNRARFDMKAWQRNNQQSFCRMFAYPLLQEAAEIKRKPMEAARRERLQVRILDKLASINHFLDKPHQLKAERVLAIAEKSAYHSTFFYNLYRLEAKLQKGHFVRDPLHLLEHNRDRKWRREAPESSLAQAVRQLTEAHQQMSFTEHLSLEAPSFPWRKGRDQQAGKSRE